VARTRDTSHHEIAPFFSLIFRAAWISLTQLYEDYHLVKHFDYTLEVGLKIFRNLSVLMFFDFFLMGRHPCVGLYTYLSSMA
jgi:hypothetical protein